MRLTLGSRSFDLTSRALVLGTVGRAGSIAAAVRNGADIVEVDEMDAGALNEAGHVPLCVAPGDDAALARALVVGASMVRLDDVASTASYRSCARAGVVVVVPAEAAGAAESAGMPARRIIVDGPCTGDRHPVLVDVTGAGRPLAATAAGVVQGARIVRTADVRGARRVCDVLAAVWEADR